MDNLKRFAEIGLVLVIFSFWYLTFDYSKDLATGALEPEWSYDGVVFSNHNVMMLFLYGVTGGGIIWLISRKIETVFKRNLVGIVSCLGAALLMVMSPYLYAMIPLLVVLMVIGVLLNERKIERKRTGSSVASKHCQ